LSNLFEGFPSGGFSPILSLLKLFDFSSMHTLHTPHAKDSMGTKFYNILNLGVYVSMEYDKSKCSSLFIKEMMNLN
jgi:hypothetical protein